MNSRIFIFKDYQKIIREFVANKKIVRLTKDQTYIQSLIDNNEVTEDEAKTQCRCSASLM